MSYITYDNKGLGDTFTHLDANELKTVINANYDEHDALANSLTVSTVNITNPDDDTWQGDVVSAVAGEAMTKANRWAPLYCKDTGTGTRFYLYNADSTDADNDIYTPIALLYTDSDAIVAGTEISVTLGDGVLSNDSWTTAYGNVGTPLYCNNTDGGITFTYPSDSGDHIKQIGTLLNITANGRNVFEISFRYPDVVVP